MEIVVNDTQILIDMHSCGLLDMIKKSTIIFHTVDYVLAELNKSPYSRPEIDKLIDEGLLKVHSFDEKGNEEFEKQKKDIVDAVQKLMDDTAKTRNYDDIFTAISYKDSAVEKFKKEAEACLAWRDLVWVTCYEILDEVVTLKRELPSLEEILEELPKIDW